MSVCLDGDAECRFKCGATFPRVIGRGPIAPANSCSPRAGEHQNDLFDLADCGLGIELSRRRRDERFDKFSPRQTRALVRDRDNVHLVALQHAQQVAAAYERADGFPIPEAVDDRLRDIFEPLFVIAAVADAERGPNPCRRHAEGANALAGIRFEHDSGEAALVAALSAREGICAGEPGDIVVSAGGALSLFRETEVFDWVDTNEKARRMLHRLGFRSATHRRERFRGKEPPDMAEETATGYEIKLHTLRDSLARYATNLDTSRTSQPNAQNGVM